MQDGHCPSFDLSGWDGPVEQHNPKGRSAACDGGVRSLCAFRRVLIGLPIAFLWNKRDYAHGCVVLKVPEARHIVRGEDRGCGHSATNCEVVPPTQVRGEAHLTNASRGRVSLFDPHRLSIMGLKHHHTPDSGPRCDLGSYRSVGVMWSMSEARHHRGHPFLLRPSPSKANSPSKASPPAPAEHYKPRLCIYDTDDDYPMAIALFSTLHIKNVSMARRMMLQRPKSLPCFHFVRY